MPSLNSRLLYLASLALLTSPAFAADWPQWRYDAHRSAVSPQTLPATLHLQWARKLPMLKTAWPDQPAMQFDDVYLPVLAGKMLYVGSSYHDTLTAYNTETGEEVWNVQADGPIRLAPVVYEGRVYFASDDSYLYCVDGAKGTLLWKFRGGPSDRKILGNERLISIWPARGGPVIADGTVYFAAGIWPFMGVFLHAVDARNGKVIWTNDGDSCIFIKQPHGADSFAGVAPQGSIVVAGDKLIVPGGRSVPACFDRKTGKLLYYLLADNGKRGGGSDVAATDKTFFSGGSAFDIATGKHLGAVPRQLVFTDSLMHGVEREKLSTTDLATAQTKTEKTVDRLGKSTTIQRWSMETLGQVPSIEAGDCIRAGVRIYVGGKGRILAHDLPLPKDPKAGPSWSDDIEGTVGCLLAGDDRLYAVTREGTIYCYGEKEGKARLHETVPPRDDNVAANRKARSLLAVAGVREGNAIIWGAGDGSLARAVVRVSDLEVVVISSDPEKVAKQRDEVRALGLSRERLAVHVADPLGIELPPYLASLMIVDPSIEIGPDLIQKMYHSLRPYGGVVCISVPEGRHQELTRSIDRLKLAGAKVRSEGEWLLLSREGALPGSADWTHEHADAANTRVSRDKIVKAPLGVLWFGGQSHDGILPRHGHGPQPQVVGGRLFIEGVDMIRAMDVYTGRILWETALPGVGHFYNNTAHQPGANSSGTNYISTADGIYVAYNQSCLRLDPATGKRLNSFPIPKLPGIEKNSRWGYINIVGDTIVGTLEPLFDPATKIVLDPKASDDDPPKKEEPKKEEPKSDDPKKDDPKKDDSLIGKLIAKPPKAGTDNFSSSKHLVVMDRLTGKLLWSATSDLGFRHNTICAGGGRLYCIDRLSGPQEAKMKRRGETPKYQPTLKVFDLKTGKEVWKSDEKIFGTWLSYSVERDILIEAGRVARDSLVDEPMGMKAYRADSGKVVWYDAKHAGPAMIQGDTILMAGNACDLLTGKKKTRLCPLTGEAVEWLWTRTYGCNTPSASEHLMTFRSGAAGYYDLCNDGGTANLGGFRSSCTNNLIVANGVLSAPDYTRTCTCQYQNQTSLALIHMPEAEMWTFFGARQGKGLVKRFGINFGAPGDRRAENGTLWTEYPSVGGRSPMLTITTLPAKPEYIRHHASRVSGSALPWVACSAIKGLDTLTIETADKTQKVAERRFTVRLIFAELEEVEEGERVFDVSIQGETVLKGLDIAKEAGGKNRVLVKEVKGVKVGHNLVVKFTASASTKVKESILGGIEVIEEEPQR